MDSSPSSPSTASCTQCGGDRTEWFWLNVEFLVSEVFPRGLVPIGGLSHFGGYLAPCPYCQHDEHHRIY